MGKSSKGQVVKTPVSFFFYICFGKKYSMNWGGIPSQIVITRRGSPLFKELLFIPLPVPTVKPSHHLTMIVRTNWEKNKLPKWNTESNETLHGFQHFWTESKTKKKSFDLRDVPSSLHSAPCFIAADDRCSLYSSTEWIPSSCMLDLLIVDHMLCYRVTKKIERAYKPLGYESIQAELRVEELQGKPVTAALLR